jgi:BolA protein
MSRQQQLEQRLQTLNPLQCEIQDDSAMHAGHAGNTGGSHFTVYIVSEAFEGLNLIARHRVVFEAVGDMMQTEIHALSIKAKAPSELNR